MTYEQIPDQTGANLNLDPLDFPEGTLIKCKVTATGQDSNGQPITIAHESNPVVITAEIPNGGDDEGEPPGEEILRIDGSLSDLRALIEAADEGGVVDLNGGCYALLSNQDSRATTPDYNVDGSVEWNGLTISKNITIRNGYISLFQPVTPTIDATTGIGTMPNNTNEEIIFLSLIHI